MIRRVLQIEEAGVASADNSLPVPHILHIIGKPNSISLLNSKYYSWSLTSYPCRKYSSKHIPVSLISIEQCFRSFLVNYSATVEPRYFELG